MREVRHTRGMTSAEVRQYIFRQEFPNAVLGERVPEPKFKYRVKFVVVLDTEDINEVNAVNGLRNVIVEQLGLKVTKMGSGSAFEGDLKRVGSVEVSVLHPDVSDITET